MIILVIFASLAFGQDEQKVVPSTVESCLQKVLGQVELSTTVNPFYLRGDFNGDGRPDYAVTVKGKKSGRLRMLVCTEAKGVFLLGREGDSRAFSDMPDDNFFSPNWMVYTRPEVVQLTKYNSNVPKTATTQRGEAIAMIWEDGVSLIYWDGKRFQWAGSNPSPRH